MNVGNNITKFRKEKKLTQEELANLINVSPKTISSYENNRNLPNIETLILLSEVLEVSIDEIIGTTKEDKAALSEKYEKQNKQKNALIAGIVIFTFFFICTKGLVLGSILTSETNQKFSEVLISALTDGLFYLLSIVVLYIAYYLNFGKRNKDVTKKLVITATVILIVLVILLCI